MLTCPSCGTELPVGAMFCGECGRALAGAARPRGPVPTAVSAPTTPAPPPAVRDETPRAAVCEQCGAPMTANDIFCGECGHVSRVASQGFGFRDTVVIEPVEPLGDEPRSRTATEPAPPEAVHPTTESLPPGPSPSEPSPSPATPGPARTPARPAASPAVRVPSPPAASPESVDDDLEQTRIVDRSRPGVRFVLQFSTGESSTVYGTGLIGRNPRPEPGEYVDQLVRVLDPGRSVSKTHLEFGQEAGVFWVLDRFSGNGTILREPDADAVRCVPDRRYRIQRGTRVEVGEQFFVVS